MMMRQIEHGRPKMRGVHFLYLRFTLIIHRLNDKTGCGLRVKEIRYTSKNYSNINIVLSPLLPNAKREN